MTAITTEQIARLLANLTPGDFGGDHCSGGDGLLPNHLRGSTPPVPRVPSAEEVEAARSRNSGLIGAICQVAEELALDRDNLRAWAGDDFDDMPLRATDDLAYHLSEATIERAAEAAGVLARWPMTCCSRRPIILGTENGDLLVECEVCATSEWRREDDDGFEEVSAPTF